MMQGTQALEVRRLVAAAVHLGDDVVDVRRETAARASASSGRRLAGWVPEQLLRPAAAPVCSIPTLRGRPATTGDATLGVTKQRLSEARDIARTMGPGQIDALVAEANDPGRTLSGSAVLKEVRTGAGSATASRRISARSTAGAPSSPTG